MPRDYVNRQRLESGCKPVLLRMADGTFRQARRIFNWVKYYEPTDGQFYWVWMKESHEDQR